MQRRLMGALALAIGMLVAAVPAQAQGGRGGGGRGPDLDTQMATLTEQLELTDTQVVQVREVLEQQGERRREMFQGMRGGGDRSAMRAALQEVQEETSTMLSEILDETQMEKYEEIQAERRQRRGPPPF